jgi:hypothetical protein
VVQPFRALHNGVWTDVPQMDAVPEAKERDESRVKSHRDGIERRHTGEANVEEHALFGQQEIQVYAKVPDRGIDYRCVPGLIMYLSWCARDQLSSPPHGMCSLQG